MLSHDSAYIIGNLDMEDSVPYQILKVNGKSNGKAIKCSEEVDLLLMILLI